MDVDWNYEAAADSHMNGLYLVDAEVLADVDHPATQASCRSRLHSDGFRREEGLLHVVLLHLVNAGLRDVVLVEAEQALEEGVDIPHELLACWPAHILASQPSTDLIRKKTEQPQVHTLGQVSCDMLGRRILQPSL